MQGFKPGAKPKNKGKGGKIQGPGTGTSDSIRTEVPNGSYIMPADSTAKIGEKVLGEIGKPVPVNVSSGEYHMPPEQVHAVGAQVLDQMKAATHTPVAAMGFKPQEGELYFADGGLIGGAAQYWANDNAHFEAGNPSFGSRVVRALNPATAFGSAMGAMHTAAGNGDKTGMALAAAQAVPVFGAMRSVVTPAIGAVKAARAMAPSAAQTGVAIAGSGAAGAMADAYGTPAAGGEQQQPGATFSDMQREPNIPRQQAPRLGFADGGLVDEERRRLPASPLAVSYGDMTGRPGARPAPQPQQGAAAMPSVSYGDMQRAPSIPQPSTPAPARRIDSAPAPQPSAQGAPRAEQAPQQPAQQDAAPTQEPQPSPTTFSSLQREPNIPRSGQPREMPQGEPIRAGDIAQGFRSAGDAVADGVGSVARDFRAGGEAATGQIAGFAGRVADALSPDRSANYDPAALGQPEPNPNAGSTWGKVKDALLYSSDAEAIRQRNAASKAAPTAENGPGAVAPSGPAPGGASPKAEAPAASPRPNYGFMPEPMQGPAQGMRVSPTSAPEINRIDNAPGLNSPLFTNLPSGQAVSEMQGGTVSALDMSGARAAAVRGGQGLGFQPDQAQQGPRVSRIGGSDTQALIDQFNKAYDQRRAAMQRGLRPGEVLARDRDYASALSSFLSSQGKSAELELGAERAAAQSQADQQRMDIDRQRVDIDRQRVGAELTARGFEARGMERVERLYQQLEAAETPEARAAIAEQLRAISGKEAPNRFTVVPGGQEVTEQGLLRTVPSIVLNNQTGQPVNLGAAQQQGPAQATQRPVGTTSTVNGKTAEWDGSKWVPR